ncbi:GNAT family N-acetyltransferase [Parabacteroides sp. AF18-52]|jgi:hypothetical protein B2_18148|uniref:GNAT family N-acetyltransferase n=1 Tax=Parabacteroides TaxID=375288 RepID=UPI000EFF83AD|nr:GNAT family N-acetyltransferase [Parabacteroides sp. AF18-52]RHR40053.1 GNAT family N-acetyltransferase [Parabacteroides sp. AF18-52]
MKQIRVADKQSPLYADFEQLYRISFPIFEQRTEEQQLLAFSSPSYHLVAYVEDGTFVGFIAYWEFTHYLYIEHFAIHTDLRGKGYGSIVLKALQDSCDKRLLLEIDPVTDDVSAKRLHFYELNGFSANPYPHIHPPYREGFHGHDLVVLTTKGKITQDEYTQFAWDLRGIVMCF